MAAIGLLNSKAEYVRTAQALALNISAAKGLQEVMKSNLGPKGTMKMLVSGSGDIKITKDGNILLHEMQIQHPTASLIARACTAMDDMTGDGTTTMVLLIAELLKQADSYISEGVHPLAITEGFKIARSTCLEKLEQLKLPLTVSREALIPIAKTSLRTKLAPKLADHLTEICVDAVLSIYNPSQTGMELDLHMIEIMSMQHKMESESKLINGLVLDHGSRHPSMPKKVKNAYILTCNVSLEYEKSEVNSGFFYNTAEQRDKMVKSERDFIEQRVNKIIELKKKVCDGTDKGFVVINQKGIDPISLDMLAKEGIMALRRAKRRNMERLTLACGGAAVNSFDDMGEDVLGYAGLVYEHVLGENKFPFVVDCAKPQSVTILINGPAQYAIKQIQDAIRDGLRAVKNAISDGGVLPGAGATELALYHHLLQYLESPESVTQMGVKGRFRVGVKAFADALLIIPKVLAINGGHDPQESITQLETESKLSGSPVIGFDINTGRPVNTVDMEIMDNYCVKRQCLSSSNIIASNLLLVDEVMRAGLSSLKQ
uniref:T-complex protein 1 subunit zeta n=1 Tax=Lygus hesperus TaxID=30085 RepID=A0A0K8T128_LYGHE